MRIIADHLSMADMSCRSSVMSAFNSIFHDAFNEIDKDSPDVYSYSTAIDVIKSHDLEDDMGGLVIAIVGIHGNSMRIRERALSIMRDLSE